ncbi:NADH:flavin oxidoreductase/NADH oxidase family protein [Nocardioides humilatus]|uniref:NADH:flavin oxidoreductase/NADH oxidase family protein n=1 Tax=Nocardioides humilatus TaxID=2607660 RepID=A0A5B1L9L2_9ACTN|nr:NADH:flavin oxidoreductase/NADH oxidase family protein [Nocardioides humilatus]KAA1416974.1 NADH:flavin oxidoreductase/NADH oxidase family protein [Nocardioides humilatus]
MTSTTAKAATTLIEQELVLARGRALNNRLAKAALSEALADDQGRVTDKLVRIWQRWSEDSGCGLLITGNVMVDGDYVAEPGNVVVVPGRDDEGLRRWAAAAKAGGNQVWMQLNHPGRQGNALASRTRPIAPSAIAGNFPGAMRPRAMSEAEISATIWSFAQAAATARDAGFDGVEIHAAHGYLISQFLSPLSNQRDDHWGGTLDNRMRFALAVVSAIRAAVGDDFPVGIKLNSADFQRGGFDEDESMLVAAALVGAGIDLIEVSGGTYANPVMVGASASTQAREAYFQRYAERLRTVTGDVPLMLTGGFRTIEAMEGALADDACDLVGLGRTLCVTPSAGALLLSGQSPEQPVGSHELGLRPLIGLVADVRQLDGMLDVQWHTDQIHRMAAGRNPDPHRPWYLALATALRRNGLGALTRRRR